METDQNEVRILKTWWIIYSKCISNRVLHYVSFSNLKINGIRSDYLMTMKLMTKTYITCGRQESQIPEQTCQLKQNQQHLLDSTYFCPWISRTVNWGDLSEPKNKILIEKPANTLSNWKIRTAGPYRNRDYKVIDEIYSLRNNAEPCISCVIDQ